jgi:hypothetical protein
MPLSDCRSNRGSDCCGCRARISSRVTGLAGVGWVDVLFGVQVGPEGNTWDRWAVRVGPASGLPLKNVRRQTFSEHFVSEWRVPNPDAFQTYCAAA